MGNMYKIMLILIILHLILMHIHGRKLCIWAYKMNIKIANKSTSSKKITINNLA